MSSSFVLQRKSLRSSPGAEAERLEVGDQAAFSIRAAPDVDALAGLARLEEGAVQVRLARRLAAAGMATLVERAVDVGRAFGALFVDAEGSGAETLVIDLAIGRQHAP